MATDIQYFQEKNDQKKDKNVATLPQVHELTKGRNWRLEHNEDILKHSPDSTSRTELVLFSMNSICCTTYVKVGGM